MSPKILHFNFFFNRLLNITQNMLGKIYKIKKKRALYICIIVLIKSVLYDISNQTLSTCGCQYSSCMVFAGLLVIREKNVGLVR